MQQKKENVIILVDTLNLLFLRNIHEEDLSLKDADEEQIQIANELKYIGKGKMSVEKRSFLKNVGLLLSAREKILHNFKSKIFPTKNLESEPESDLESTNKSKPTNFWKKLYAMNQI